VDLIRVEIDSIRVSLMSQDRVVVLKDQESDRYLPIWIGPFEAEAIRVELQGMEVTRPLTHDLLKTVIMKMGGELEHVVVTELRNDVFYATLKINVGNEAIEIDARPSDSIALAVRLKVPIFVATSVMERAGIEPEDDIAPEEAVKGGEGGAIEPVESSDENLDAFKDFLDTLDLDDLEDQDD
jgi:bifunctional DNase/RNase